MDCYSFTRKRLDESDIMMVPETGIRLHQGLILGHPMSETPFSSGEFQEVSKQFPIRQHQYGEVRFVSSQTGDSTPRDSRALNGMDGLLNDAQIRQFISSTVLPHHRTLTRTGSGRVTRPLTTQTYTPGVKEGPLRTDFMATPTSSQTFMEVEPPRKRFLPSSDQTVFHKTRTTPTLERVALLSEANRFLSDEQINQFITSTVLPTRQTSSGSQSRASNHTETPNHSPKQTSAGLNRQKVIQLPVLSQTDRLSETNNVSQRENVSQTEVIYVPKETTSPQRFLVPHRNIVSRGINVPDTKTLKVPYPLRGQNICVSRETEEETVLQQKHTTTGHCNKGLIDPKSVCDLSVQSATSKRRTAGYMYKDEFSNSGSQSEHERPVQSVTANEKLVHSQQMTPTPQHNKGYKKMYEEPKGKHKFSGKRKRKGKKNCQHGKPQKKTRKIAVQNLSSGSQSEGETESGENESLEEDEDDDMSQMIIDGLLEEFMEKLPSSVKDKDTLRDHYRDFYTHPDIRPHQSLLNAGILIPCEDFYLDLNLFL